MTVFRERWRGEIAQKVGTSSRRAGMEVEPARPVSTREVLAQNAASRRDRDARRDEVARRRAEDRPVRGYLAYNADARSPRLSPAVRAALLRGDWLPEPDED